VAITGRYAPLHLVAVEWTIVRAAERDPMRLVCRAMPTDCRARRPAELSIKLMTRPMKMITPNSPHH
jgi:hypothetical protein